jgi:2-iminobutanoate/2-iminopropanoate deaminase
VLISIIARLGLVSLMKKTKQVIGGPLIINGRELSLSRAVRAGDFVFLTGQIPMRDGLPMTDGSIEDQTRASIEGIRDILREAGCELGDVVKSMVWLKSRDDFAGFNEIYAEYFTEQQPARSAIVCDFLVDVRVEIECIAYKPLDEVYTY